MDQKNIPSNSNGPNPIRDRLRRTNPSIALAHLSQHAFLSIRRLRRSRRKKGNRTRATLRGARHVVGSHLDGPQANQCPLHDRGKHRRCIGLKQCEEKKRGVNRRKQGAPRASRRRARKRASAHQIPSSMSRSCLSRPWLRTEPSSLACMRPSLRATAQAEKKAAKELAEKLASDDWIPVEGWWAAQALEGRGHQEGPHYGRRYRVIVERADFGELLFPGGQARFTEITGGDARIFNLPMQIGATISFDFEIDAHALGGMCISVRGLEVRARAA